MINSVTFIGEIADRHFKIWQKKDEGFYLNIKGEKALLHVFSCWHLGDAEGMNSAKNSKICSNNIADLQEWARINKINFQFCSDCNKE